MQDVKFQGLKLAADWIRDLESSDSRIHKEKVIEKALMAARLGSANAQCFLFNCYEAYNPFHVFGVRQVPETAGIAGRTNPWPAFWGLLESLRTRSVTGHAARDAIVSMSEQFDSEEWNGLCRRVIIKDLRCGISEKTLNKILGRTEWKIPVFTCQLATDSNDHANKMTGIKRIECKLDGVRVLALCSKNRVTLYSRNGKIFENFPDIETQLDLIKHRISLETKGPFVLDGEIVGESFQALMKQAQRKDNVKTRDMNYYIFDVIPLADFERGFWNAQQHKRTQMLDANKEHIESQPNLRIMPGMDVDLGTTQGQDVMRRFADDAVEAGYEGIMIKSVDAPYECRRSSFWMKWKPVMTVDLNIVGFEEGTGRNAGRLGAIICEGVDSDRDIRVNVGSGLSDENRDEYWHSRDDLVGRVIEVAADAVTQNQDGTYSLRFPRFVRFRGFEPGEKM